jgi:beta-glucosidase
MVSAVAAANPRTVVVASVPGAILMPWSTEVAGILTNFMPGQQAGNAITDVLFGKVNPSGKLPLTFPNMENETAMSPAQWPGLPQNDPETVQYSEGLLVGYRFYDAMGIKFTTGFPFGHGLSYTEFGYSKLSMEGTKISVDVKNTGPVAGAEVVQLYLGFPEEAGEPPLQLKGFHKTRVLKPGETQKVAMTLSERDLSIWDSQAHAWSKVAGTFKIMVGSSSRDIRLQGNWAPLPESRQVALV